MLCESEKCEICSKLATKTLGQRYGHDHVFIVNTEYIPHLFLVFLLLRFNK